MKRGANKERRKQRRSATRAGLVPSVLVINRADCPRCGRDEWTEIVGPPLSWDFLEGWMYAQASECSWCGGPVEVRGAACWCDEDEHDHD